MNQTIKENRLESNSQRQDKQVNMLKLNNSAYTSEFLKGQIGKLMKLEFLIGTNNIVDKTGFLEHVEQDYVILRTFGGDNLIYAEISTIKFITISVVYAGVNNFKNYSANISNGMNLNMYY